MIPVLVVGYLRPQRTAEILQILTKSNDRDVYVFIDGSHEETKLLNMEVKSIVEEFSRTEKVTYKFSKINLGAGDAVPTGLDWVFREHNTEALIILEDDCIPTQTGLNFFENSLGLLNEKIALVCGSTYLPDLKGVQRLCSYPLISGWMTTRVNWNLLRSYQYEVSYLKIFKKMLFHPQRIIECSYFLASLIRARKGKVQAWDSALALGMLLHDLKSIVPNVSLIDNVGKDLVATHTIKQQGETDTYFSAQPEFLSPNLDLSKKAQLNLDHELKANFYKMRVRHLLSPLKSTLISLK